MPTYNEADNVVEVVERVRRALSSWTHEVIVVDDDSTDGTGQIAVRHFHGEPAVRVIHRFGRRGLASAVLDGMEACTSESFAVIDGDLQHDETALPQMVQRVLEHDADICVGTRSCTEGSAGERPMSRQLATSAGTAIVYLLLSELRASSDPLSGFFVVSRAHFELTAPK